LGPKGVKHLANITGSVEKLIEIHYVQEAIRRCISKYQEAIRYFDIDVRKDLFEIYIGKATVKVFLRIY